MPSEPRSALALRNCQRTRPINLPLLRQITRALLASLRPGQPFALCVNLVGTPEIIRLNETYLRHAGPTDVITFDYGDCAQPGFLHGEIFLCVDVALRQARRFRASWQSEITRYVAHGLLHLHGYTDRTSRQRRRMKAAEDRLCRQLSRSFRLSDLGRKPTSHG